ncbi:MAG TPA: aspartate aminotransferase family protein [Candidatus Limnocylindrales bacterium]|nr:aspartate aminotransferase family protein [Candidatus Limnocylindrales bacterium]
MTSKSSAAPRVVTAYPGPEARRVIERMRAVEGAGPRTGGSDDPLVVAEAHGATLVDPDGNEFVDLAGSFAAANVGHSHPDVVAAIRDQAGRASHVSSAATSEVRVAFEEALVAIAPAGLDRVLLGLSGADANDTALKLARSLTGRREVIAFSGGYFGRAGGVIGLNGKSAHRLRVARDGDAQFLPYPDPDGWTIGPPEHAGEAALALVRNALEDPASGIGPVAAIVLEPVQGNGGVIIPPAGFLRGLRALCDRHGIVLVFDEIQSGFGRTGRLWAAEHWDVVPDLMTVGKGVGGGMAVSAVVGRREIMGHWTPGTHTSTFMGNAVSLAAGRAAIGVMRRDRLWERSERLGARIIDVLRSELADVASVGAIRGLGLFIGIEIVTGRDAPAPDPGRAAAIRQDAFHHGVVAGLGGRAESVLKICPPLTIEEPLLDVAVGTLIQSIKGVR